MGPEESAIERMARVPYDWRLVEYEVPRGTP